MAEPGPEVAQRLPEPSSAPVSTELHCTVPRAEPRWPGPAVRKQGRTLWLPPSLLHLKGRHQYPLLPRLPEMELSIEQPATSTSLLGWRRIWALGSTQGECHVERQAETELFGSKPRDAKDCWQLLGARKREGRMIASRIQWERAWPTPWSRTSASRIVR